MNFNNDKFLKLFKKHIGAPPYTAALARDIGVKRPLLYKIYSEGNPGRDSFARISMYIGVGMEQFYKK